MPYFGTIRLRPGKNFVIPRSAPASSTGLDTACQLTPALTPDHSIPSESTQPGTFADFTYDPYISFQPSVGDMQGQGNNASWLNNSALPAPSLDSFSGQAMPQIGGDLDETWDWVGFFNQTNGQFQ